MVIKAHIRALTPYLPPLEGRNPDKFTLLDFNERTVPVPAAVTEALKDYIDKGGLQKYPAYGSLGAQIAEYSGVPEEQCMFTNGSDQGIDLAVRCCCEKGTEVIIPSPTFAMYEQAADAEGLTIVRPHFDRVKGFPLEAVLAAVTPKTSMIVLSNPNNPTGTIIPRDAIMEIAKKCPNIAILVDECYYEFLDAKETVKDEVAAHPNLLVTRTFSKTWGIPSLRLGYLISAPENIRALCCVRGPYDVNQLAAVAVEAALANRQYVWDYVEEINKRSKPKFEDFLRKRNIVFWPSVANFIFCYFDKPAELEVGIRSRGILVRPKKDADGVTGLRVTIGTDEQTDALIKVLEELLDA
jgi:histidinol-phosphate aminotransferase